MWGKPHNKRSKQVIQCSEPPTALYTVHSKPHYSLVSVPEEPGRDKQFHEISTVSTTKDNQQ